MSDAILVNRDGPIATVILNNPDKRNALTKAAWSQLAVTMQQLSAVDDLRCIMLRGAGSEAFSAGADISEFPQVRANAAQAENYGEAVDGAIRAMLDCRHPTIAMILGACTGGALAIACACDLRICGESARFGVPINRLGHALAYPEMKVVLSVVSRAVALEALLEGRLLDARESERRGLVNRAVADSKLEEEAYATAQRIAKGAPLAARANKRFVRRLDDTSGLSPKEMSEGYALCDSEDYKEGVRAFFAKEKPAFKGR
ncbi:MAG: enoyl-CoA hydratase-related protein [Gammaproteobacteria bacterium]|nr:enoyl-CoA hydratase-related protein [Gammaproteobacteria bacterium]